MKKHLPRPAGNQPGRAGVNLEPGSGGREGVTLRPLRPGGNRILRPLQLDLHGPREKLGVRD